MVDSSGANWTPESGGSGGATIGSAVVVFTPSSGATDLANTYQVWTHLRDDLTAYSFDPYAPAASDGNYLINNTTPIPPGTYTVSVASAHYWSANGVVVNDTQSCPYSDYYTGQNPIGCQIVDLELLDCLETAQGSSGFVQLEQPLACDGKTAACQQHHIIDSNSTPPGSGPPYVTDPTIVEVYIDCAPQSGSNCHLAPNTGIWGELSSSIAFWGRMVEYAAGVGSYGGSFRPGFSVGTTTGSGSDAQTRVSNDQIASAMIGAYGNHELGTSTIDDTVFVVYLPSNSCAEPCSGSHTSHHFSQFAGGHRYNFALVSAYADVADQDATAAHEVAEATTDPDSEGQDCGSGSGCGWNEPGAADGEGEIADFCGSRDTIYGHSVAKIWSQAQCACI